MSTNLRPVDVVVEKDVRDVGYQLVVKPFVSGAFTPVAIKGRWDDGMTVTVTEPTVQTDGTYRDQIVAVEPGGNEYIAEADRHGKPSQLFWTWTSPNLEFATIFVGVLAVAVFGMNFWPGPRHRHRHRPRRDRSLLPVRARPTARGAADGARPACVRVQGKRGACRADVGNRRGRLVRH
jgi:hypothetical protein